MTKKQKIITGIKIGAIITVGSIVVGKVCRAGIERYRKRNKQEEVMLEEESE